MSLHFVAGASGAGKSRYIYEKIIDASLNDREGRFFVLVPEQYTMQTQKELTRLHPSRCILNIDVLSFNRLAFRVFGDIGKAGLPVLEDMGKLLVAQKVIWQKKKELQVLSRTLETFGSAEKLKSLISECRQYCIYPEDLARMADESSNALLAAKTRDISILYKGFEEYIEDRYLTAEDVPEILSRVIDKSDYLKGSTIVLDGFTGFVPSQLHLMEKILSLAKDVYCVVTIGKEDRLRGKSRPSGLFHMSHQLVDSLLEAARLAGCGVEEPVRISGENGRLSGRDELIFLENSLFRYKDLQYPSEPERIRITECADEDEETDIAASRILREIRENGRRFSDFAVVTGALEETGEQIARRFSESGIPVFLDKKIQISANPLLEFIRGAVSLVTDNFSYTAVMRYLRSGLAGFSPEETDRFENYILAFGIKGRKKYLEEWQRTSRQTKEADAAMAEELRRRLMSLAGPFAQGFSRRGSTIREKTRVLYDLMVSCDVQQKLKKIEEGFGEDGSSAKQAEYAQIYKAVMDFFDKLVSILGEEKTGSALYEKLIDAGLSALKLGAIPGNTDQVIIGDIERSRIRNVKTLFFMNVNDGIIPKNAEKAGLLSDSDREAYTAAGLELSPGPQEEMFRQRFYLYLNLTIASEEVCISYHRTDKNGKAAMPSYFINMVRRLFPKLQIRNAAEAAGRYGRLESRPGRDAEFIDIIRKAGRGLDPAEDRSLFEEMLRDKEEGPEREALLSAAGMSRPETGISPAAAKALYSPQYSVTRLESYADCAFKHFCGYGLRLSEREIYEFTAADLGTVLHNALMRFSYLMREKDPSWRSVTDEERARLIDQAMDSCINDGGSLILRETGRARGLTERMRSLIAFSSEVLTEQVKRGRFIPEHFELPYKTGNLKGIIDRLDVCEAQGVKYYRVIDYKTGSAKLDLSALLHGHCLQLPVYMTAAADALREEHTEPAGIYYYMTADPMISVDTLDEPADRERLLKNMQLKGLSRSEREILELLDEGFKAGERSSSVIDVSLKSNGELAASSKAAEGGDFILIERYIKKKTLQMEEAISAGDAKILPVLYGTASSKKDGCAYCPYRGICGYDERIPGYRHKFCRSTDAGEALQEMSRELTKKNSPKDQVEAYETKDEQRWQ